jgi:hypothetical protein
MLDHQDAWTRFMTDRWSAGDCTRCDAERDAGEDICRSCGTAVGPPSRKRRGRRP